MTLDLISIMHFPIKISEVFTLKPSLQLLWRNDPSFNRNRLARFTGSEIGTVLTPLKNMDFAFFTNAGG